MIPKSGRRFSDKIMLGQMLEPVLKLSEPSSSARYHGGTGPLRRVVPVTILRPDVLDEVERFIRINQPPAALSAHAG
jgi:hypothetical protein